MNGRGLTLAEILDSAGCIEAARRARAGEKCFRIKRWAHEVDDDEAYDIVDAWQHGERVMM